MTLQARYLDLGSFSIKKEFTDSTLNTLRSGCEVEKEVSRGSLPSNSEKLKKQHLEIVSHLEDFGKLSNMMAAEGKSNFRQNIFAGNPHEKNSAAF